MTHHAHRASGGLIGRAGRCWGLDLGFSGELSRSLNTTLLRPDLGVVVRIYRPGVGIERVAALQAARRVLDQAGLPVVPLVASSAGRTVELVGDRAVEVEQYVPHDGRMNTPTRLVRGAVLLAGVHEALARVDLGPAGDHCPYANWISPDDVLPGVHAGVARIRSWGDPADQPLIDTALRLADLDTAAEVPRAGERVRQLVHVISGTTTSTSAVSNRSRSPIWIFSVDVLGSMTSP